jgi:hypothetical protein
MNNISFQGTTHIKYDKTFDRLLTRQTRGAYTNFNLSIGNNYKVHNGRFCTYDPNESPDVSVLLLNEKGGTFFHNAESKISEICKHIDELKKNTKEKLTAWIIGGYSGPNTTTRVNKISNVLCDRDDIDTSIIAGVKPLAPSMTFHQTTGRLDMTVNKPIKGNLEDSFENYFDIVELNNTKVSDI